MDAEASPATGAGFRDGKLELPASLACAWAPLCAIVIETRIERPTESVKTS